MSVHAATALPDWLTADSPAIQQAIRRAGAPGYQSWWARCAAVGFCANPVHASADDPTHGSRVSVMIRCGNRRAAICPSCSDLYAADTWQLIHAGTHAGHHGMPTAVADRPQVFATLTAPSFGPVHTSADQAGRKGAVCHAAQSGKTQCPHGNPLWCNMIHRADDPMAGQPLCPECYDYTGHVLFNWHAPELWRRFTIALRRALSRHRRDAGADPTAVRVSFVKIAEYQRRAVIHYHTLIRLDPTDEDSRTTSEPSDLGVSAVELAVLVHQAADQVRLPVPVDVAATAPGTFQSRVLGFGAQIDTRPLTALGTSGSGLAGRVAAYLAKYTTKSVAEFGIAARRISPQAIGELPIAAHTQRILSTLVGLAGMAGGRRCWTGRTPWATAGISPPNRAATRSP